MKKTVFAALMCIGVMLHVQPAQAVTYPIAPPAIDPAWSDALYYGGFPVAGFDYTDLATTNESGEALISLTGNWVAAFSDTFGNTYGGRLLEPGSGAVSDYIWFDTSPDVLTMYLCSDGASCFTTPPNRQWLDVTETGAWLDVGGTIGIPGYVFAYSDVEATPLPAALPLLATGLGALGLLGWRRKRKNAALAA
jgi:hypothetical protein